MRASIEEGSTHVKGSSRVGQGGQTQIERGNKNAYPGGVENEKGKGESVWRTANGQGNERRMCGCVAHPA